MREILLRSADGNDTITICIGESRSTSHGMRLMAEVRLAGVSYPRIDSIDNDLTTVLEKNDYDVQLPQVVTSIEQLRDLSDNLEQWHRTREPFHVVVAELNELRCTIEIEVNPDFICSSDRPVLVFGYSVHRFATEVRFVVDDTCIDDFRTQLTEALRLIPHEFQGNRTVP